MTKRLTISHIMDEIPIGALDTSEWQKAESVVVSKYWSGEIAPESRGFSARLLWSDEALYVRFEAVQGEPLIISKNPNLEKKSVGLWERDVCEIFVAPDLAYRNKYYEFEVAPTGEWIDIGLNATPNGRLTDWEYRSEMETAARIEEYRVLMAIRIPFKAFGRKPDSGELWLGNLFRCVGSGPDRGYLAWQPTLTDTPSFHVPEAFGEFVFK